MREPEGLSCPLAKLFAYRVVEENVHASADRLCAVTHIAQVDAIEYVKEENCVLKECLGGQRIRSPMLNAVDLTSNLVTPNCRL